MPLGRHRGRQRPQRRFARRRLYPKPGRTRTASVEPGGGATAGRTSAPAQDTSNNNGRTTDERTIACWDDGTGDGPDERADDCRDDGTDDGRDEGVAGGLLGRRRGRLLGRKRWRWLGRKVLTIVGTNEHCASGRARMDWLGLDAVGVAR